MRHMKKSSQMMRASLYLVLSFLFFFFRLLHGKFLHQQSDSFFSLCLFLAECYLHFLWKNQFLVVINFFFPCFYLKLFLPRSFDIAFFFFSDDSTFEFFLFWGGSLFVFLFFVFLFFFALLFF